MKDNRGAVLVYHEIVSQIQVQIDIAYENRKIVHFNSAKTGILEVVEGQAKQAQALRNGLPMGGSIPLEDKSVVYVRDPTLYPVLLRRSLEKVHPDWTGFQISTKAMNIVEHEFGHGGEAIQDPGLEEMCFGVMFVEDIEDGKVWIQPFMAVKGNVDHLKITGAPDDQSEGDKAFVINFT